MKKLFWLIFLLPVCLAAMEYVPKQLIVQTTQPRELVRGSLGLPELDNFLSEYRVQDVTPIFRKTENNFYLINLQDDFEVSEINDLRLDGVENIQPNYLNSFSLVPNDLAYEMQRIDFENINLPQTWDYTTGNSEIMVAIVDSGLNFDHPDLQENIFVNENEIPDDGIDNDDNGYIDDYRGWDFVDAPELSSIAIGDFIGQDNDATDEINHGTHIAGIIGASTNNDEGIAGVLWDVDMLIVRAGFGVMGGGGYLQDDDAAAAVIYAADMGADVINISWGDVNYSPIIAYAVNYAYRKGSILVCAAGNEGAEEDHPVTYPAKLATTISVGAVDSQKRLASFSSYGSNIDLVAPGQQIYSTYDSTGENVYYEQSGTSMAAPFVTAATALLLSVEPQMNFHDVRTRLLTTCEDLGDQGVDNKFGHGLLDCYSMLTAEIVPRVEIDYPLDKSGFSQSFDIYGTATCLPESEFFRYFITYTYNDNPDDSDWHSADPYNELYQYEPVADGYLGTFVVEELMPETEYQIKVEVVTSDQQHYSMIHRVNIDQSAPELDSDNAFVMERYFDEYNRYYIGAVYNESIDLEVEDSVTNEKYYSTSSSVQQIIQIPVQNNGVTDLNLKATNLSGLTTETEHAFIFPNQSKTIDTNSWEHSLLPKQLIPIRSTFDFDDNGREEIIAIEIQPDSSHVPKAFEFSGDQLIEKHLFSYNEYFWPYDVGSMEEGQVQLLGRDASGTVIYEAAPGHDYPETPILTVDNCYGGRFVDVNNDGLMEVALTRNIEVNGHNHRVITVSRKFNNQFTEIDTLWNTSPIKTFNTFSNQMESADFNGDFTPEILTADSDGDVMIFQNGEMIWSTRMPVGNIHNLAVGDFDADGSMDFGVGGYNFNTTSEAESFSYYAYFTYSQTAETYVQIGSVSFDNLLEKNSMIAVNLDEDPADETVILAAPNIYLIDFQDGEFKPIWRGESIATFNNVLVALPASAEGGAKIIAPIAADNLSSCVIIPAADFSGPDTPTGFQANPFDATSATLNWDESDHDYYKIFRNIDDQITEIATTEETSYLDQNLETYKEYEYSVAGYDADYIPATSRNTLWKKVIPAPVPQVENIVMCSPFELKIFFSEELHNNSINIQHFSVNNELGLPASVNFINAKHGVMLSFTDNFSDSDAYTIAISGIQGTTGIYLPDAEYAITYQADTVAPYIASAISTGKQVLRIYFSETMQDESLLNLNNYQPVFPAIDSNNQISSVEPGMDDNGFYAELSFTEELKYTNQRYFMKLRNVYDLAGNQISNDGNKCSFTLTDIVNLKHMIVYPNPLYLSEFEEIRFANLPLEKSGNIRIYDLAGDLIFSDEIEPLTGLKNYYSWNAKNASGKRVSSGMYLYFIKVGNDFKKGKLAVIH